jgi:GNAT superfamily N-acetyltransferase
VAHVRRFRREDGPVLWTLNNLPNIGHTADETQPLRLDGAMHPPAEFPDLADIEGSFLKAGGDFLVAEEDGCIIGMAGVRGRELGQAEVLRVRVHPAARRRGIGTRLMQAVEHRAPGVGVHRVGARHSDQPARRRRLLPSTWIPGNWAAFASGVVVDPRLLPQEAAATGGVRITRDRRHESA